eukprot:m.4812 g.4812  ORF g.4812 m.4812 type:complete len:211 (+) comp4637_c0_seq1:79-711(+)
MRSIKLKVEIVVERLRNVPYKSAVVFCRIKHPELTEYTPRVPVKQHEVCWNSTFTFTAKLKVEDGQLVGTPVKLSLRRETAGGQSYAKMGHVMLDITEYAGRQGVARNYLLLPDTELQRQDNSVLKVLVSTTLVAGELRPTQLLSQTDRAASMLSLAIDQSGGRSIEEQLDDVVEASYPPIAASLPYPAASDVVDQVFMDVMKPDGSQLH